VADSDLLGVSVRRVLDDDSRTAREGHEGAQPRGDKNRAAEFRCSSS
jgi:hypothetical protein